MEPSDEGERGENEADSYEKWLFSDHVYEFQALPERVRKAYLVGRLSVGELIAAWKREHGE